MSSRWKGSRISEQTFDILSPCRNLNTVNGTLSTPNPSTCLNSSFTYALSPGVAHTHSRDPDPCFSANNSALFQDVVTDGDPAQQHTVFEVVAFVQLTLKLCLWYLYSTTQILAQESHIISPCSIPGLDFSSLALQKLVEFEPLKNFFCSSSFLDSILKSPKMTAASFSQIALLLLCVHTLRRAGCLSPMTCGLFSLLLRGMLSCVNVNYSSLERLTELCPKSGTVAVIDPIFNAEWIWTYS